MFFLNKYYLLTLIIFSTFYVPNTFSQTDWTLKRMVEQKSVPLEVTEGDYFGSAVAISDKYAVVGSKKDDETGKNGGSVYIYEKKDAQWEMVQKFIGDEVSVTYLGISVELNGDFAFAGAPQYDLDEDHKDIGLVYIYKRQATGEWVQTQKLIPDPIDGVHEFGDSIAAIDDLLIIGASGNLKETGKAFIFRREGDQWIQEQQIEPEQLDIQDRFGCAVDISSEFIIVGAFLGNGYKGLAYIFQKVENTWQQIKLLTSPSGKPSSQFGRSVCINDQYAVIGSYLDTFEDIKTGVVYVYKRSENIENSENNWELMPTLVENNLEASDKFGISLDLDENLLMVGASKMNSDVVNSGVVLLYRIENDSFTNIKKIVADHPESDVLFGSSLAFSGSNVIIGSEILEGNGPKSGGAYFYSPMTHYVPDGSVGIDDVLFLMKRISQ
ncbi:PKD domain-containing protein [Candidatus Magnetomorum sp. HK-1]|nr:PKD domain-containing protein [Candidatus Magnetomorum sp. HK-1]